MQDNSEVKGTFGESQGLSETDAEKLFEAVYNGEDVSKLTSAKSEEPPPEQTDEGKEDTKEATPADTKAEEDGKGNDKGNSQVDPNANPYAWVDSLSDQEMKAKVSQILSERFDLEHRWKSDNGRLRSAAKAVDQLKQEIQQLKEVKPQEESKKTNNAAVDKLDIPDDPEWSKIAEADSELARAIEKRAQQIVEARLNKMAPDFQKQAEERAKAAVAPFEAQQREQEWERDMHRLRQEVPNLNEVLNSRDYQDWVQYYATPELRDMALAADSYSKAVTVLKSFDYDMRVKYGTLNSQAQHAQTKTPVDTEKADKLAKEREEKLNKAVGNAANRQPTPAGDAKKGISTLEEQEQIFLAQWK